MSFPSNPRDWPPDHELREKRLSDEANRRFVQHVRRFGSALMYQARLLAFNENADTVLNTHMDRACDVLQSSSPRKRSWKARAVTLFSGIALGAGLKGFVEALISQPISPIKVGVWAVMGFLGLVGQMWTIFTES